MKGWKDRQQHWVALEVIVFWFGLEQQALDQVRQDLMDPTGVNCPKAGPDRAEAVVALEIVAVAEVVGTVAATGLEPATGQR